MPDSELYLRATATATFKPMMQYHPELNHHQLPLRVRTPLFVAETNDDPHVADVFRRYAPLRERLVPHPAEQARATIATGRPLVRGLFFDWPDDATMWAWPAQFLLGDDLLIHPVTDPEQRTGRPTCRPGNGWTSGQARCLPAVERSNATCLAVASARRS